MNLLRKITRILGKTILFSLLFVLTIAIFLFIAFQTESFQTYAAQKATAYLSDELGTRIEVKRLKITFVKNVTLEGVFMSDLHGDTLMFGESLKVNVSGFDYKNKKLNLDEAELTNIQVKLLKYKGEEDFNFQFLADYFAPKDTIDVDTVKSPWKIKYGALVLKNVDFTYRLLRDTNEVGRNMNYNNLHVSSIYGNITDIDFKEDTIFAQIKNLTAKEQCGIVLQNLTTKARISPVGLSCDNLLLKTDNSLVKGDFSFKYDTWNDYNDFVNKVYIKAALIDSTYLNMQDITYFSEDINGFKEKFFINGKVRGFVNDLSGTDMLVKYRDNTRFVGDLSMSGLPNIDETYMHFDAEKLTTDKRDLEKFPIPPFDNPKYLKLPKEIAKFGVVSYKGKFDGFLNNFATYGTFKTAIGTVKTDLQMHNNPKTDLMEYTGSVNSSNFQIARLLPNLNNVGNVSLSAKIKGKGITIDELDTRIDGMINSIAINNYSYNDLQINGTFRKKIFKGALVSHDPNADFSFDGSIDLNYKVPKMDFISTINNFDLEKTNLATSKLNGRVSSQILIDLHGDNIDNLSGLVNFDNTIYKTTEKDYNLSTFNLELNQEGVSKSIKLTSNILNAKLDGKYNLSSLSDAFTQYLNTYFPTFIKTKARYLYSDKADLKIKIRNFTIVQELFIKDLALSPNTTIDGSFDASINYLYLTSNSDLLQYAGVKFKTNKLNINSHTNGISLDYNASSVNFTDSFAFKNPAINLTANDRKTHFDLTWDNLIKPNTSGQLGGNVLFNNTSADVVFDKARFVVVDSVWQMVKANIITIDTAFTVNVSPITFYNQNQLITLEGKLSKNNQEKLDVLVQNFKLGQFNSLLADSKISMEGAVSGTTSIYGVFDKSIVNSDLSFTELKLNNKLIGAGEVQSHYNPEKDYVEIAGFSAFAKDLEGNLLKNVEFQGYYFPKKQEDNLDITFKAEPFDLSLLQPYLEDIITIKLGYLKGNGRITGSPDKPQINAKLKFFKCIILVDYLNVQYTVSGNVDIMPNQINFENIEIRDKANNVGIVYGNIFHSNFKNIRIDFDINTNKLMMLNTAPANNPSYYGTAFASGNAGIYGFLDDIKMELNMKTNGGTYFYIPLDGPSEVGSNNFITFITKDTVKKVVANTSSHFSLDFNLEATPDAEVQLIFDEKSGDVIKARGQGNLNMKINSKGKFDMFGDYVLTTGDYLFTLENFVTKKFEIQPGSSIKWNGNVYKADIDITAIYRQRASLRPIYPADSSGKRYTVDCKLYMKNKLTQPDISFGIDLPTIDENARSSIKSVLSDETELNRQVFSLLLLRSFVTPVAIAGGGGISAGGAVAATGSEMLSNKLSHWLNGVTKNMDVGVNYRPGTGLSNDELDLTLNKQLFNNRLVIDGNFGVSNGNSSRTTTNNGGLIGDVTVEYKLSQSGKYRVKGFNRSNDNTQIINNGGPFTQGVGIFYREEFETINELFKRYLDKLKKK